jgi:hypothetical protein
VAGALVAFGPPTADSAPKRAAAPASAIADKAGLYRNLRGMGAQRLRVTAGKLETENGVELVPIDRAGTVFQAARGGTRIVFKRRPDAHYDARIVSRSQDSVPAEWVPEADTARATLAAYAGRYESPEAETAIRIAQDSTGALVATRVSTPGGPWKLRPIYRDGFAIPPGVLVFTRNAVGQVNGIRFSTGRVRNLLFNRTE